MLNILNKLLTILDSLIFVKDWIAILRYTITGFSKEKKINFYFFFQFALIIHLFFNDNPGQGKKSVTHKLLRVEIISWLLSH